MRKHLNKGQLVVKRVVILDAVNRTPNGESLWFNYKMGWK